VCLCEMSFVSFRFTAFHRLLSFVSRCVVKVSHRSFASCSLMELCRARKRPVISRTMALLSFDMRTSTADMGGCVVSGII